MKKSVFLLLATLFLPYSLGLAQKKGDADPIQAFKEGCMRTLKTWNDAINSRDEGKLSSTYCKIVRYYQSYLTIEEVDDSHAKFFKKNDYYHQYYDNVKVIFINECQAQLSFDKHVQMEKDKPYKTYHAYMHFLTDYQGGAEIIGESDQTTDTNLEKKHKILEVDNDMTLNDIFCEENVGKKIEASYWDLVENGEKEDGPLANLILISGFPRSYIDGFIVKDYNGKKGTYACGGYAVGSECQAPIIFTYNPTTKEKRIISIADDE